MYGLRNSELSTCLFQLNHKTRQTMLLYAILLAESTLNANLTTTNRFCTNDDWQRGRFENFESDHQYESNLESDVRFEIESNHEASQVSSCEPINCKCLVVDRRTDVDLCSVSPTPPPPLRFSDIFPNGWEFLMTFTSLLYVCFNTRLQIFILLFPTLTKLYAVLSAATQQIFYISLELLF